MKKTRKHGSTSSPQAGPFPPARQHPLALRLCKAKPLGAPNNGFVSLGFDSAQPALHAYGTSRNRALDAMHEFTQSMSRKADCLDNAVAESFFGTLKSELVANVFGSHAEARRVVFDYIECFYNTERLHSYLGYKSPVEFEQEQAA